MALLAMDGFDHYDHLSAQKKGWSLPFTSAMSPGRFSLGQGCNWTPFTAISNNLYPLLSTSTANVFIGFGWQFTNVAAETPIFYLIDGSTVQVAITYDGVTGIFRARAGTGIAGTVLGVSTPQTLTVSTWHFIELVVVIGNTGSIHINIDGTADVVAATSVDTMTSSTAQITHVALPASSGIGGNVGLRYDDLYVLDSSGTGNNAAAGDCRVYTRMPSSDGAHTDQMPSGPGTHFSKVNSTILSDASFVSGSVVGNIDSFGFTALPTGLVISAVQVDLAVAKDDAGSRSVIATARIGTTDYTPGSAIALTASTQITKTIIERNPATSAVWLVSALNTAEFGTKVAA